MENIIEPKRTEEEVNFLNPLVWAYKIGRAHV